MLYINLIFHFFYKLLNCICIGDTKMSCFFRWTRTILPCSLFILIGVITFFAFAEPRVLIKIPTRACPQSFFETLDAYERNLSGNTNCRFLITCDKDDASMNNEAVIKKLKSYSNVRYEFVAQKNPIALANEGINSEQFDILVIGSDDNAPFAKQFDKIILQQFQKNFPSYDGILVYRAGARTSETAGIFVIGRVFYNRFGFVFNPVYQEFYAPQELLAVAKMLRKYELSSENLFTHKQSDAKIKSAQIERQDKEIFEVRRDHLFDLTQEQLCCAVDKDWSILICTMYERQASFKRLSDKLQHQINELGLQDRVEILYYLDNRGEHSTGAKRNWLLTHSRGAYINFIDDDDDVSDDYIKTIHNAIMQHPDSVSLKGLIAFNQYDVRLFIHSIKYNSWFEQNRIYYRPPNHLNTIKRYIGVQFSFPDITVGEDQDWSMQIANAKLVKTEVDIKTPYYFYLPSYCHDKIDFSAFREKYAGKC